ncbi:MAG: cytochrome c biogenesis protein CcmG/thiol:disulfide interchange protein DsbE [Paracoccaceae bacterium]|jgi:cytochrome c biogenesis protein CcmG/thiol:disulfide interchange protein DsbE
MSRISPLMVLPPVLFGALAVLFYTGMGRDGQGTLISVRTDAPAPIITLTTLVDKPLFVDDDMRTGGVKLVNYWASWCAPCRVEHPQLVTLAAEGIPIYGINYKDKAENALKFLDEVGDPYTAIGSDLEGRTALDWGVYGVPETYVIDATGKIILRFAGPITEKLLESAIRPALVKAAESSKSNDGSGTN